MSRTLLHVSGADTREFLQGLVTNDVAKLDRGPVYAALLTPQGKYVADFFLIADSDGVGVDVAADLAGPLKMRMGMYKLRADVAISETDKHLHRGTGPAAEDGWTDPRHPDLGWRAWRDDPQDDADGVDWDALRVSHAIPESGVELTPDSYILEHNFEALNGVDFRKGCYVGQEVTARMKHKTELRKGLARVRIDGAAEPGADITSDGKPVGTLLTRAGDIALAYLRFDRANGTMSCGDATVERAS